MPPESCLLAPSRTWFLVRRDFIIDVNCEPGVTTRQDLTGKEAVMQGLTRTKDWNGKTALCEKYLEDKGKWEAVVNTDSGRQRIRCRSKNLLPVQVPLSLLGCAVGFD